MLNSRIISRVVCLVLLSVVLSCFSFNQPVSADDALDRVRNGVVRFTLPNGLRVLYYRRGVAPVFTGEVWVKVGAVDEPAKMSGIAHLLEHMAFKGTESVGTKDYTREKDLLERLEALVVKADDQRAVLESEEVKQIYAELSELWTDNEFGRIYNNAGSRGLNAGTAKDYTYYTVSLPSVAFELWCWMESERLLHPVFRQFYSEREVVREERRMNWDDNPQGILYETLFKIAYFTHPNRLPTIGLPSDLARVTATEMKEFYTTFYRPDNIVLSLVGDLEEEEVRALVERYFSRLPKREGRIPTVDAVEPEQRGRREAEVLFDAERALMLGYHKPVYPDADDSRFAVMHELLSGGRSSILERELVQEKRLASGIETFEGPGNRFPSLFIIGATPQAGVTNEKLQEEIQRILDRLRTMRVDEKKLAALKRRVRVSLLKNLDSNSGLSSALGEAEALWGDWTQIFQMYDQVNQTTAEDLSRLATTYLKRTNSTFVHLEKPK